MQEFKIEINRSKHELRTTGILSACLAVALAATVVTFAARFCGMKDSANLEWSAAASLVGTFIFATALACREALFRATRQMVFVLDDAGIVRIRKNFPTIEIPFREIESLQEDSRWLLVLSIEPRRKIAIPVDVESYQLLRSELAKRHALTISPRYPLKGIALSTLALTAWAIVLWTHDRWLIVLAGGIGLLLLMLASYRLWALLCRMNKKTVALMSLGIAWILAIAIIWLRLGNH